MTDVFMGGPARTNASYDEEELVHDLRELYRLARDYRRNRYENWRRNYMLVNNRFGGQQPSNWMPAPRDSEIYPILSSAVGWFTDQEISVDCVPAVDPNGDFFNFNAKLANDLSSILYSIWLVHDYPSQAKLMLWDAFTYGLGISKSVWDSSLDKGKGNAVFKRVDPYTFYPDPFASTMEDANFFVEVRRMTIEEIERRFPDTFHKLETAEGAGDEQVYEKPDIFTGASSAPGLPMLGSNMPTQGAWPGSNPQVQGRFATSRRNRKKWQGQETYYVYEYWLRDNEPWEEEDENGPEYNIAHMDSKWRVVVMCNGCILMDEDAEDLWSHESHPYERFAFDDIGEFYGISLVDHLAYPQIYLNRLLTAVQHNTELTGNPVFLEATNSGTTRIGVTNRPGGRIPLQGSQAGANNLPRWLQPPSMPTQVQDLIQFWIERIENISGLTDMQKGKVPSQRQSGDLAQQAQEAAFVRIRSAQHNLERMYEKAARKICDLVIDNYDEPRFMAIIGDDGRQTSLAIHSRHFMTPTPQGAIPLEYTLQIRAGASGPTSRMARINEADRLFSMGVVDDQYVLEAHQTSNIQKILPRLYKKKMSGLVGAPPKRQAAGRQAGS